MQGITFALGLFALSAAAQEYRYVGAFECAEYSACMQDLQRASEGAKVAATTVYLADIAAYPVMNQAYETYFTPERNDGFKPARNTVQTVLRPGIRMSLSAILYTGKAKLEGLTPPGVKNIVPITPAIRTPQRVFIAGILGRDSNTGAIPASPDAQLDLCFTRLANVLSTAKLAPSQMEQATLYHTEKIPRESVDAALSRFFGPHWPAAVTIVAVPALALGAQVGIHGNALNQDYSHDVSTLDAAVKTLYDVISGPAGQARDWDRLRHLMHPQARFQAVRPQGGIMSITVDEYISRNGRALVEQGFFESETSRKVESFEGIAHVWSGFAIRRSADTPVLRTGINSIQLYWDRTRWWVMSVYWDNAR
jgi:enamine deaminase RidA (YjgF/YER057c/UK114 family)